MGYCTYCISQIQNILHSPPADILETLQKIRKLQTSTVT